MALEQTSRQHRRFRSSRKHNFSKRDARPFLRLPLTYDMTNLLIKKINQSQIKVAHLEEKIKELESQGYIKRKDMIEPIKPWKPAEQGTVDKYSGILVQEISALSTVSEDKVDRLVDELRDRDDE